MATAEAAQSADLDERHLNKELRRNREREKHAGTGFVQGEEITAVEFIKK